MQDLINEIAAAMAQAEERGKVADYIPELGHVDPQQFAISLATVDGRVYSAGCATTPFSIQSISKVFTLTIALGQMGDSLWTKVGREPSGDPFNSIVQLEHESGKPRNPFINSGAIAVVDAIMMGHEPKETLGELLALCAISPMTTASVSTMWWRLQRWPTVTAMPHWRIL